MPKNHISNPYIGIIDMFESENRESSNQNRKIKIGTMEAEIRIEVTQLTRKIVTALCATTCDSSPYIPQYSQTGLLFLLIWKSFSRKFSLSGSALMIGFQYTEMHSVLFSPLFLSCPFSHPIRARYFYFDQ